MPFFISLPSSIGYLFAVVVFIILVTIFDSACKPEKKSRRRRK